jgi:hypothetical protein
MCLPSTGGRELQDNKIMVSDLVVAVKFRGAMGRTPLVVSMTMGDSGPTPAALPAATSKKYLVPGHSSSTMRDVWVVFPHRWVELLVSQLIK